MPKKPLSAPNPAMASIDAQALRSSARSLPLPIRLRLAAPGNDGELICTDIIRNLPGKRMTCYGVWKHNTAVVAKIYLAPYRGKIHFEREVKGIRNLALAGISTPPILFEGTLSDGATPVVLSQRVHMASSLQELLAAENRVPDRTTRLLKAVLTSIAQMHDAGLSQRDIHPGNFLMVKDNVMVIDGGDIRLHSQTSLAEGPSIDNLALFLAQFYPKLEAVLPELVAHYCHYRHWRQTAELTSRIEKAVTRWSDWREKKFLQKTVRPCTAFMAQRSWHRRMACDRNWYSPALQHLLDDPDAAMDAGTILKAGNTATVAKVDLEGHQLVIKRYNLKNRRHAMRRALRPTRAIVSWRNANRLRFMGIPTPHPRAFIEGRWGPIRKRAYFIADYVEGESIDRLINQDADQPQAIMRYVEHLIALLRSFYLLRISHNDMKATNFIFHKNRIYVLDLDGMKKHHCNFLFQRAFDGDLKRLLQNWKNNPIITDLTIKSIREYFKKFI